MIYSYTLGGRSYDDPNYDPYPENIYIHDNEYRGGGTVPGHRSLIPWHELSGLNTPNIVWDGIVKEGGSSESIVCLGIENKASFMNLMGGEDPTMVSYDKEPHLCSLPRLSKIEFNIPGDD